MEIELLARFGSGRLNSIRTFLKSDFKFLLIGSGRQALPDPTFCHFLLSFSPSPVSLSLSLFHAHFHSLHRWSLSLSLSRSHHLPLQSHRLTLSISLSSAHHSRTIHRCQSIQFFLLARRADRGRDSES
ncbi:hypothetical protein WN943_009407 [Citrus x changshan-huyou]